MGCAFKGWYLSFCPPGLHLVGGSKLGETARSGSSLVSSDYAFFLALLPGCYLRFLPCWVPSGDGWLIKTSGTLPVADKSTVYSYSYGLQLQFLPWHACLAPRASILLNLLIK